jgi:hypothetical protein
MKMSHAMHRLTSWIAICAILMAALAPTISHAIAAASDAPNNWIEICSVNGSKLVNIGDEIGNNHQPQEPVNYSTHFEHCPFCMMHAISLGMPPSAEFKLPVLQGSSLTPSLFFQAPRPLFAWTKSQPRAPPFFS